MKRILALLVLFILLIILGYLFMFKKQTAEYSVYIGWPTGYYSQYNNAHSILKNKNNETITHFGMQTAITGALGRGVKNTGTDEMEVPSKIEVMWLSFLENQYWHGEFDLDTKLIEKELNHTKILDVFNLREGLVKPAYRQLVVNVAPEGKVYIYVSGTMTKLVGVYQAKPIEYNFLQHARESWFSVHEDELTTEEDYFNKYYGNKSERIDELNSIYSKHYFDPVQWRLSIQGDRKIIAYAVNTLNGEYQHILSETEKQIIRSIPSEIAIDMEENNSVRRIDLKLSNTYQFYNENFNTKEMVNITLDLPNPKEISIYFKQGDKMIEFNAFEAQELDR